MWLKMMCLFGGRENKCCYETEALTSFAKMVIGNAPDDVCSIGLSPEWGQWWRVTALVTIWQTFSLVGNKCYFKHPEIWKLFDQAA